ncbi:MAG: hypothetical protein JXP36_03210 [Bacteroidales bacterium]|nr:hypothetical protein [Bacteroidales bacterium]
MLTSVAIALPPETEYTGLIPQTGSSVNGPAQGYEDDGYWGPNPIGFTFNFFGNDYTEFYVTSNGLVTFGGSSTQYSNNPIPTSSGANNYIAAFWDDIVVHATGDIMYQTIGTAPNRKLIVQFNNMSFYGSPVLLGTFQVILYEGSNCIQTQYRSIVDLTSDRASGNSATIGLENASGTAGVTYSYNTGGMIHSGDAIRYCSDGSGSYTIDDNVLYEGVLLVDAIPRAGIASLVSPGYGSTIGEEITFQWDVAANAVSYNVQISQNSDISSPIHTSADLSTLTYDYTLSTDQTYYWSINAKNSAGLITWSEI